MRLDKAFLSLVLLPSMISLFTYLGNGAGAAVWAAVSVGAGYVLTYVLPGESTLMGCLFHGIY